MCEQFFLARKRGKKKVGCFFRLLGVFFVLVGGAFVLLGCFRFSRVSAIFFFFFFFEAYHTETGNFRSAARGPRLEAEKPHPGSSGSPPPLRLGTRTLDWPIAPSTVHSLAREFRVLMS